MKTKLLACLLILGCGLSHADTKITGMTATTTLLDTDIIPVVTDPAGTPTNKKITKANLYSSLLPNGAISNAPTINTAPQFSLPYYSFQGSSNTLSSFPGVTASTNTGVTISTLAATGMTIKSVPYTGFGHQTSTMTITAANTTFGNSGLSLSSEFSDALLFSVSQGSNNSSLYLTNGLFALIPCNAGDLAITIGSNTGCWNGTSLRFGDTNGDIGPYVGFKAPASTTLFSEWTLPSTDLNGFWKSNGSMALSIFDLFGSQNRWTGTNTYTSSMTVTAPLGAGFTYGVSVGSMTGAGLSTCGDATHALAWSSTNNMFSCQSVTGSGGGGGSSTLEVMANGLRVSSPTASINAVGNAAITITGALTGAATGQLTFSANPSSVTLQGVVTAASLGALTANQSITLSGDSTGTGTTAITVTAAAAQPNITTLNAVSGVAVVASTFNVNNVKMIWPSSGTTGNYLRYISSNVLTWDGVAAGGGNGDAVLASTQTWGGMEIYNSTNPFNFRAVSAGAMTVDSAGNMKIQTVFYSTAAIQFKCPALDKLETNFAVNTATNTATSNYLTCSFDNATRQYVNGYFMVPGNLDTAGTITIRMSGRSSTAAGSKNVGWFLEHQPMANGTSNTASYLTSTGGAQAVSATQGVRDVLAWTMSASSSTWTANNTVNFRFSRDVGVTANLASPYYLDFLTLEIPITAVPSR